MFFNDRIIILIILGFNHRPYGPYVIYKGGEIKKTKRKREEGEMIIREIDVGPFKKKKKKREIDEGNNSDKLVSFLFLFLSFSE